MDMMTDSVIDSRDIIERIEELQGQISPRFIAGWNIPGYMPDCEPAEFDNEASAKEYIAAEMESEADQLEETGDRLAEARAKCLRDEAKRLREEMPEEYSDITAERCYWFTQDGTMGLDEEEQEELDALRALAEECEGYASDWRYGESLIARDYFVQYIEELIDECFEMPKQMNSGEWPYRHMTLDYEAAAKEAEQDYATVEYQGREFLIRAV